MVVRVCRSPGQVSWPWTGLLLLPYLWGNYLASPATADSCFSQGQVVLVSHSCPVTSQYLHALLICCHSQPASSQHTAAVLLWLLAAYGWARCAIESHPISITPVIQLFQFSSRPEISLLCTLFLHLCSADPSISTIKKIKALVKKGCFGFFMSGF